MNWTGSIGSMDGWIGSIDGLVGLIGSMDGLDGLGGFNGRMDDCIAARDTFTASMCTCAKLAYARFCSCRALPKARIKDGA